MAVIELKNLYLDAIFIIMQFRAKKPARNTSYRYRYASTTTKEARKVWKLRSVLKIWKEKII